jgi:hypothetical protein
MLSLTKKGYGVPTTVYAGTLKSCRWRKLRNPPPYLFRSCTGSHEIMDAVKYAGVENPARVNSSADRCVKT